MPPKKTKKKKSKEELERERLEREEEERRRLEEEERQREEERRRKEEEERRRLEELARLREQELRQLRAEHKAAQDWLRERGGELSKSERAIAGQREWEDFVRCSPRPDVRKDGELNTFLTEVTADDATEPTAVMRMVENVEAVVQDLLDQAARADETEDVVERARCLEFVRQLRTACVERADAVTAQLLQRADEFATPKNEVLLSFATQRAEVQLGLWINLASKGFRTKNVPLPDTGVSVDIPKALAVQVLALRTLRTQFHFAAKQAAAGRPEGVNGAAPPGSAGAAARGLDGVSPRADDDAAGAAVESAPARDLSRYMSGRSREETVLEIAKELHRRWRERSRHVDGELRPHYRHCDGARWDVAGVPLEQLPETLQAEFVEPARAVEAWLHRHEFPCRDMPVGGVLQLDLLMLPEPPKRVKGWTLRVAVPLAESLERHPYPASAHGEVGALAPTNVAPLKVRLTLPPHTVLPREARVGWWDAATSSWQEDGVGDVRLDAETRTLGFQTTRLAGLALLQPRHCDLPYSSWAVTPTSSSSATVRLRAARFEVGILVHESACELAAPDCPELAHLLGRRMAAGQLLRALEACGIMLRPVDDDANFVRMVDSSLPLVPKRRDFETSLYRDLVSVVAAFAVTASRFNQARGMEQCVFRVREVTEEQLGGDADALADIPTDDEWEAEEHRDGLQAAAAAAAEALGGDDAAGAGDGAAAQGAAAPAAAAAGDASRPKSGGRAASPAKRVGSANSKAKPPSRGGARKPTSGSGAKPGSAARKGSAGPGGAAPRAEEPARPRYQPRVYRPPPIPRGGDPYEHDWKSVLYEVDGDVPNGAKCSLIASRDTDSEFDDAIVTGCVTHVYLHKCLESVCSPGTLERLEDSSMLFQNTLLRLLRLLRPLSFG